jgi:hypothetical protein
MGITNVPAGQNDRIPQDASANNQPTDAIIGTNRGTDGLILRAPSQFGHRKTMPSGRMFEASSRYEQNGQRVGIIVAGAVSVVMQLKGGEFRSR